MREPPRPTGKWTALERGIVEAPLWSDDTTAVIGVVGWSVGEPSTVSLEPLGVIVAQVAGTRWESLGDADRDAFPSAAVSPPTPTGLDPQSAINHTLSVERSGAHLRIIGTGRLIGAPPAAGRRASDTRSKSRVPRTAELPVCELVIVLRRGEA